MDSVVLIGRLLVSLACVLGVVWFLSRRLRRGTRSRSNRTIEVLDRASLTRSSSVAVVRVGDRALVLGVADAQVSVLGETDLAAAQAAQASQASRPAAPGTKRARRAATRPGVSYTSPTPTPATPSIPAAQPVHPAAQPVHPAGPLAGSALSPQTWRQTIESLRDLTSRT